MYRCTRLVNKVQVQHQVLMERAVFLLEGDWRCILLAQLHPLMFHASSIWKMASFTKDAVKGVQRQAVDDGGIASFKRSGIVPSCLSVLLNLSMCLHTHTHTHTHTHIYIYIYIYPASSFQWSAAPIVVLSFSSQDHVQNLFLFLFPFLIFRTFCLHFSESLSSLSQDPHQDTVSIWYYKDKPTKVPSLADVHFCVVCLS